MQSGTAIYEYFHVPHPLPSGNFRAKCKLCRKSYATSRMVTSNLVRHMKRQHASVYVKRNLPSFQPSFPVELPNITPLPTTTSTQTFKYPPEHPKQVNLDKDIVQLLATGLVHLDTLQLPEFEALVNGLDSNITCPSPRKIANILLPNAVNDLRRNIASVLNTARDICLIINLGTNRRNRQSFIAISATCVTNWTKQTFLLSCSYFDGGHTSVKLLHAYSQTTELFHISSKVAFVVIDHASNISTAINLHKLCAKFRGTLTDVSGEDNDLSPLFEDGCDKLPQFPNQVPCFAHALQLTLDESFESADISIRILLSKVTAVIEKLKGSPTGVQVLHGGDFQATRWGSMHALLNATSCLLTQAVVDSLLDAGDRSLLTNLVDLFEPIEDVVDRITAETEPNSNIVILTVLVLERHLEAFTEQETLPALKSIVRALKMSLERLRKYIDEPDFIAAVVVDPRYKTSWAADPAIPKSIVRDLLPSFEERFKENGVNLEAIRFNQPKRAKIDFSSLVIKKETLPLSIVQELDRYLEEPLEGQDSNILTYWKNAELRFPKLNMLAKKYLALNATPATPVEQVCNTGTMFRPNANVDSRFSEMLTFLTCNKTSTK